MTYTADVARAFQRFDCAVDDTTRTLRRFGYAMDDVRRRFESRLTYRQMKHYLRLLEQFPDIGWVYVAWMVEDDSDRVWQEMREAIEA